MRHRQKTGNRRRIGAVGTAVAALTVAAAAAGLAAPAAGAATAAGAAAGHRHEPGDTARTRAVCGDARPGYARCLSVVRTDPAAHTDAAAAKPKGYGPGDLASAYKITGTGAKKTIGIVIAFHNPNAAKDLAVYRKTYGLPACGKGCLTVLDQHGSTTHHPDVDGGWALEGSLDLDMASAACPTCTITLVEADDNSGDNLAAAADTAAEAGADVISNSYGADEYNGGLALARHYRHPGVAVFASSGDAGLAPASYPAGYPGVTAVGGTTLTKAKNARGWTEKAWGNGADSADLGGAGSGCSAYVTKPAYQHDNHCRMRTIADISAVADPDPGLAIYDTTPNDYDVHGWAVIGGTSASNPYLAGLAARSGHATTFTTAQLYRSRTGLYDPTGGSNGYCGGDYLCTGKKGYDAPTGVGSPHGLGAFG